MTTAGGCGDTVRNITGCPVQGLAADELFDASPVVDRRGRPLLRQPRLGQPAAEAQVLDLGLRRPLQRARRSTASRSIGTIARGPRGVRGARRRRALLGAADRARDGRLHPEGGRERDPRRDHRASGRRISSTASRASRRASSSWSTTSARRGSASASRRGSGASSRTTRCRRSTSSPRTTSVCTHRSRRGSRTIGVPVHLGLDLGRPDDRDRRPRRAATAATSASRASRTSSSPAIPTGAVDEVIGRARRHRLPARRQPGARELDRLHRRAALQLLGRRDEDAPRRADRPPRRALRDGGSPTCGCTSTAAPTPARSTGSATSASRGRRRATRAECAGRPTTSSSAAASAPSRRSAARSSGASRPTSWTLPSRD